MLAKNIPLLILFPMPPVLFVYYNLQSMWRGFIYTFPGSLTTPPCTENVTWFVLKHSVTLSAAEIEQSSKLYRDDARPTQPLYDRTVLESQ